MKKHLLIILVMVVLVVLATTACGSDTAMTPQNSEPVIETPTPEPTPTPDVPENVVPATPESPAIPEEPPVVEEPTIEEPTTETPALDRRRHFEIRTSASRDSESGIAITGRGVGAMDSETKQTLLREIAEDVNYAFAEQLEGSDGSPLAQFNYHFQLNPDHATAHRGWITLDIKATGESILVSAADFGNRGRRVTLMTGGVRGTTLEFEELGAWIIDRGN